MLITNGVITRNIAADKLPEYKAKGYSTVEVEAPAKPKKAAKTKAGDK